VLRALVGTAIAIASVGCGSHPDRPRAATGCGSVAGAVVERVALKTADGVELSALRGGSGSTGVVLVPESPPADVCGWLPYIAHLEAAGLRVVAVDYRGTGESPEPADPRKRFAYGRDLVAAVDRIRHDGATRVFVVGASFGGAVAMAHAGAAAVDGIVSLSGETALPAYRVDALAAVPRLRVPLLVVGTRHDSYLPVRDARRLVAQAGSIDKRAVFFPGRAHAWDIVESAPYAPKARRLVLAWIRAHG
jgi:pimeloyl-ACP methyl ester carboxylesterase